MSKIIKKSIDDYSEGGLDGAIEKQDIENAMFVFEDKQYIDGEEDFYYTTHYAIGKEGDEEDYESYEGIQDLILSPRSLLPKGRG